MTLTGFIDNRELTLSESVISLELPQDEHSSFVNFDDKSFQLTGKQNNYNYQTAAVESTLDFSLSMVHSHLLPLTPSPLTSHDERMMFFDTFNIVNEQVCKSFCIFVTEKFQIYWTGIT